MPHHEDGLAERVSRLEDVNAIRDLKSRYARGIDSSLRSPSPANAASFADLFTDDGILDLGPLGRYEGKSTILNAAENIFPAATIWAAHHMVNPLIEVNGDEGTGQWYFLLFMQPAGTAGSPPVSLFGEYFEKYQRTPAGWKFKEVAGVIAPPK